MAKMNLHGDVAVIRSKRNRVASPRLKAFNSCIADKLAGTHPGSRSAAKEALKAAAHACSGRSRHERRHQAVF